MKRLMFNKATTGRCVRPGALLIIYINIVRGVNHLWGESSVGQDVHGAKHPWGETSMGRSVHGAKCLWGKKSINRVRLVVNTVVSPDMKPIGHNERRSTRHTVNSSQLFFTELTEAISVLSLMA